MQQQEKHSKAMVLGLQHLLAMYSGSILVPMMIGKALGYNTEQLTYCFVYFYERYTQFVS